MSAHAVPVEPSLQKPVIALVGRPNAGKSSLYNRVTGGHARVANFPGITVEVLATELDVPGFGLVEFVDLPGVYSLETATDSRTDEGAARAYLDGLVSEGRAHLIVQVLDATQLALGLRLTAELIRRGDGLLLVATHGDVLIAEGRELDVTVLSRALGVPVVLASSRVAATRERVLMALEHALNSMVETPTAPSEWDSDALARSVLSDRADADELVRRRRTRTDQADRVLMHPVFGPVIFVATMTALFAAVFLVADPASAMVDSAIRSAGGWVTSRVGPGWLTSLFTDGVLGGAGTVLAFLPQIVTLTLAMELLEGSGYLARGAFLIDRLLRGVGLGGRSFVPLLMAHACAVPAIAATRILRDPRERLVAMLVLPLMACSARIPVYGLLIATFFAGRSAWVKATIFVGLYFVGITSGLAASAVLRRTMVRGRGLPLVLEMPAYRAPDLPAVQSTCKRAASGFLRSVGTSILAVSIVLWVLLNVPMSSHAPTAGAQTAETPMLERSVAASIGRALEPVTRPIGFDWRINVSLIGAFGARELMVGSLGVIFGVENAAEASASLAQRLREARGPDGRRSYSTATALALMAFFVFACQCISTVAALRRETQGWRWPAFLLVYTYLVAYIAAFAVYHSALLAGFG